MPEKDTRSIIAFSSVMLSPSAVSVNCLRARGMSLLWPALMGPAVAHGGRQRRSMLEVRGFSHGALHHAVSTQHAARARTCHTASKQHLTSEEMRWSGLSNRPPACTW